MDARAETGHRYQEVAQFITELVENGTLAIGSRAPSLREICRQRRISLSTALQATGCWRTAACWRHGRNRATTWRETGPAR
jgi:DNA-binding transcriptional MocR family regulator